VHSIPFVALLDNDKAGKQARKVLIKDLFVDPDRVLFVSNDTDQAIEDLFTPEDFRKCFLSELDVEPTNRPNSRLLKDYDSVLLSKQYLEKAISGNLPELKSTSRTNFQTLASRIATAFEGPQLKSIGSIEEGNQ